MGQTRQGARIAGLCVLLLPLLLAQAGATTAAGATAPAITRSPGLGPVGTAVRVTGTGFGAGETVILKFDATQVGAPTADSTGAFPRTTFTVPSGTPLGKHTISATGMTSGLTAMQFFTVVARINILQTSQCTAPALFCYKPPSRNLPVGNWVQWRNGTSAPHTVTRCTVQACGVSGGTGTQTGLGSPTLSPAQTYRFRFTAKGTYVYYCAIHGYNTMHGTINVTS